MQGVTTTGGKGCRVEEDEDEVESRRRRGRRARSSEWWTYGRKERVSEVKEAVSCSAEAGSKLEGGRTDCPRREPVNRWSRSIMRSSHMSRVWRVGCCGANERVSLALVEVQ